MISVSLLESILFWSKITLRSGRSREVMKFIISSGVLSFISNKYSRISAVFIFSLAFSTPMLSTQ
ncbi:hypothetical protein, partial [Riemerella anatipestifer]|uniref:hypothetical protein n=1 Tax=Riemerella anatipestifer TaxID=34085 RepID=UPI001E6057EA